MRRDTFQTVYLSNLYEPSDYKPIFLPGYFSLIFRQIFPVMIFVAWAGIPSSADEYAVEYSGPVLAYQEHLSNYLLLRKFHLFLIFYLLFVNVFSIMHYFYATYWSAMLNTIYYYWVNSTAMF